MRTQFFKSTHSGSNGTCVEVAHRHDVVVVRDSKYTGPAEDQPIVTVAPEMWPAFLDLVLSNSSGILADIVEVSLTRSGDAAIATDSTTLVYDADEWDAFIKGIADGQFDRPTRF